MHRSFICPTLRIWLFCVLFVAALGSSLACARRSAPLIRAGGDAKNPERGASKQEQSRAHVLPSAQAAPARHAEAPALEELEESGDFGASSPAASKGRSSDRYQAPALKRRPGLGTSWGERRSSAIREVSFTRKTSMRPFAAVTFHYDDERGIEFSTGRSERSSYPGIVPVQGGALEVSLAAPDDDPLPLIAANGRRYVIGESGDRYVVRIRNHTGGRFEIVTSVDGLDVIDGHDAAYHKRGYLIEPWGTLRIEGFRESSESIRAFRFGEVADSYAVKRGRGRDVGVVGIALFEERGFYFEHHESEAWRRSSARPFPGKYAPSPAY